MCHLKSRFKSTKTVHIFRKTSLYHDSMFGLNRIYYSWNRFSFKNWLRCLCLIESHFYAEYLRVLLNLDFCVVEVKCWILSLERKFLQILSYSLRSLSLLMNISWKVSYVCAVDTCNECWATNIIALQFFLYR